MSDIEDPGVQSKAKIHDQGQVRAGEPHLDTEGRHEPFVELAIRSRDERQRPWYAELALDLEAPECPSRRWPQWDRATATRVNLIQMNVASILKTSCYEAKRVITARAHVQYTSRPCSARTGLVVSHSSVTSIRAISCSLKTLLRGRSMPVVCWLKRSLIPRIPAGYPTW
jgi:hypothetical protein